MGIIHSPFFDVFPTVDYNVTRTSGSQPETVPNIFFRISILKSTLAQASAYDRYLLEEGDTPEIISEKMYGDSGAGWIIIYANKIFDPQFDWPLTPDQFEAYLIQKYGSIEKAQTSVHHIDKVVTIENMSTGEKTVSTFQVSPRRYTDNLPTVPFEYWTWNQEPTLSPGNGTFLVTADTTAITADNLQFNITADIDEVILVGGLAKRSFNRQYTVDGDIFNEYTEGRPVSVYDYEFDLNDSKKLIRVVKSTYYNRIMNEFRVLTGRDSYQFTDRITGRII